MVGTTVRRQNSLTPKSADRDLAGDQKRLITLQNFILEEQLHRGGASGALTRLLYDIVLAAKLCHREINKAGLADILGDAGDVNVQGETQKKLDVYANEQFKAALEAGDQCCAVASEEDDDIAVFDTPLAKKAKYIVAMDPLDGSSNIDVNVSVGTIFAVYRRHDTTVPVKYEEFLRPGRDQVASGYVIYGSSTMLVYTTGHGVNGFTLDPAIGEFCLSHKNIRTKRDASIYSINEGNLSSMPEGIKKFVHHCQTLGPNGKATHTARYIGSLVADFHRNLLKGGIYLYPRTADCPQGRLRLIYECNPMAYIAEQAGGSASDGEERILDLVPTTLHQRTPFFVGAADMVQRAVDFLKG